MNASFKFFTFLFLVSVFLYSSIIGCGSSQQEERRAEQLRQLRSDVEKLKEMNRQADISLDSLYRKLREKDEELKLLQLELDSLQKNMEQESE